MARHYSHAYYLRNRDAVLERTAQWGRDNPDSRLAYAHNYRAKALGLAGYIRPDDIKALRARTASCHWCCASSKKLEIDHIVPLELGGSNDPHNLCLACRSCNRRKAYMLPVDFALNLMRGLDADN
jgi:5-methylcytosine-specific restriction endonuclease McrA